jgi:6-phosphogluconolactonase
MRVARAQRPGPARESICAAMVGMLMHKLGWIVIGVASLALVGCPLGPKYSVGGTLTGLSGSGLVLDDNSGKNLSPNANGSFTFSDGLSNKDAYSVTVVTQPSNPTQTCSVHNGSGTIDKNNITNVIVSCTQAGRFAYVANQSSNNLSAYAIDSATGSLTAIAGSPFAAAGTTPVAALVDPNGAFLYVADDASSDVSVFAIDPSTGILTPAGFPAAVGSGPDALTIDPSGRFLYVANLVGDSVSAFSIDPLSGLLTQLSGSPFSLGVGPSSLKVDPNGNFLYVANFSGDNIGVFAIDPVAGTLSTVAGSPFAAGGGPVSIVIDPTGAYAYVANQSSATISEYSINSANGALTAVSGSPLSVNSSPESLGTDPAGRYVYAANVLANNQVSSFSITPTDGVLTISSTAASGSLPAGIAVDPAGTFIYVVNDSSSDISVYSVNSGSGALAQVTGSPFATGNQPRSIAID